MTKIQKEEIKKIADQFAFTGELISCAPCGSGHINGTYMLRYRIGEMGSIKVIRDYPNTVVVQVTESVPTYALQTKSGWLTLSDQFKILACESAQPE